MDDLRDNFEEIGNSNPFGDAKGNSLGKAEVLIGCLPDATSGLADWVNVFRKTEINSRIAEIEASAPSDPRARHNAFAEVARRRNLLDQLDNPTRWPLATWKADNESV